MSNQRDLYRYNRTRLHDSTGHDPAMLAWERRWIDDWLARRRSDPLPCRLEDLQRQLSRLLDSERETENPCADYVATQMNRNEFRLLVQEFAVDGLTEAQPFYYVMPRLPLAAQMPMLRILIDEFGGGNPRRAHTQLYMALLQELDLPTELGFYIPRVAPECLGFVNLFYWLALRADDPSCFAGAITYLESAIPAFFQCYVDACRRLDIAAHAYYSEHQHIDAFHAVEGQRLLQALEREGQLSATKAWLGARLASDITAAAFEAAVNRARTSASATSAEGRRS
jgi:hypothetical protein